jgi:hypothetical protein
MPTRGSPADPHLPGFRLCGAMWAEVSEPRSVPFDKLRCAPGQAQNVRGIKLKTYKDDLGLVLGHGEGYGCVVRTVRPALLPQSR